VKFHVFQGARRDSYDVSWRVELGARGSRPPVAYELPIEGTWRCTLAPDGDRRTHWTVLLAEGSCATLLDGVPLPPLVEATVGPGATLATGGVEVRLVYDERVLPPARSLDVTERRLLHALARDPEDDRARSVLADHWEAGADSVRGQFVQMHERVPRREPYDLLALHGDRWRRPARTAGFPVRALEFEGGFLREPLAVVAGEPLEAHPELLRLSPRYYVELGTLCTNRLTEVIDARAADALGGGERVVLKAVIPTMADALAYTVPQPVRASPFGDHPNLPRHRGRAWRRDGLALVLDWAGLDLRAIADQVYRRERAPAGEAVAVSIALQLCTALEAIHGAGLVHGAIHGEHVLVDGAGVVTLIGGAVGEALFPRPSRYTFGSPSSAQPPDYPFRYFAPEQVRGLARTAAVDLYAVAVLACELVAGTHPVIAAETDDGLFATLEAIRDGNLRVPALSAPVAAEILRACARLPETRHATAAELRDTLAEAATAAGLRVGTSTIAEWLTASLHGMPG
jgi:hypothetical protein